MSSQLQYGNDSAYGSVLSERNHYSQFVHLPNGITKLSGQGGWARDGSMSADDPKGQIEQAFNNVDFVLKEAGLSGWKDVYLIRTYQTKANMDNHWLDVTDAIKKWIPHRPVFTALTVPRLAREDMVIEVEVEAYRGSQS